MSAYDPSASHVRFGVYFFPGGQEGLVSVLNNGFRGGGGVEHAARGVKCLGCGAAVRVDDVSAVGAVAFAMERSHAECAGLIGHRDYCLKRQKQPCSCGKEEA